VTFKKNEKGYGFIQYDRDCQGGYRFNFSKNEQNLAMAANLPSHSENCATVPHASKKQNCHCESWVLSVVALGNLKEIVESVWFE